MNAQGMAGRAWFNRFFGAAALAAAFTQPAFANDPPAKPVTVMPALPAGAETGTYLDPRKRFSIRHDAQWVLMPNWAGGVEAFCRWAPCQKSVMTSCTIALTASDGLTHEDLAAFNAMMIAGETIEDIDLGFLGEARFLPGNTIRQIGDVRWFVSGIGVKLFDTVPLETRNWWGLSGGSLLNASCAAHKDIMPKLTTEMERLLSGLSFTKP